MKQVSANQVRFTRQRQLRERGSVRIVLLAGISFLLGVAATAFWFQVAARRNTENQALQAGSPSTAGQTGASAATAPSPAKASGANPGSPTPAVIAEVKRALPDYASLPVEQGAETLRRAALKDFTSAAKEMEIQIAQAEAKLSKAQSSQSTADQQAAMQHLRQIQSEQTEKLQQIAAHLQLQLAAFQELKAAATNAAK